MEEAERARKVLRGLPVESLERPNAELDEWRERVASFRTELFPFVPPVPPTVVALFGWRCSGERDTMSCADCKTVMKLQPLLLQLLMAGHAEGCLWRSHRVDPHGVLSPGAHSLVTGLHANLASLPSSAVCGPVADLSSGLGASLGTSEERARLAVCGWRAVSSLTDSAPQLFHCDHCQRTCAVSATFDPLASHRPYCIFRLSRARAERMARSLPPDSSAAELPSYVAADTAPPLSLWLARLVLGLPDE
jgi:hypothetical protein